MDDPHVVALSYRIEHHSSVDYDKASPLEHSEEAFEVRVERNNVWIAMNRHYATQSEALEAVEGSFRAWEHLAALQNGPNEFRLVFEQAEIEDRDPVPGAFHVRVEPVHVRISVGEIGIHVSKAAYPRPPDGRMEFGSNAKLMFERYVRYRAGREYLTGMANFCLTVLEQSVQGIRESNERLRRVAARHYDIDLNVFNEIGRLCACKGGTEARKCRVSIRN